ncbi:phospho-N-acetylmuramoyl-pentapeptide-transferase [Desulfosporosinus sp. HMP52]|uniref:Phospho-N-acetylmuramoyl-pentapeptide-transferase n=1 Tax=Desulfosporosinus hippei DSM 8344 TaxID=1121419 RepID=A0A1G7RT93_9FIRM|nr:MULTISPECIES: phospho-N-acetylmuramoyl-pentapeptide-transferase [Desulfosporosinus]KGK90412.1 phospho-N-acetylmuramoyl-pentapeptide-transferase [Desulfosporosinus sp. HMP52]SDG13966.1 Phospho-N-acetylmuramoyl-pentapeptide-transferase [Desulfosporosinus hippei DSM 8344]
MSERLVLAAGLALIITLVLSPFLIPVLRVLKFGQNVRDDGPKRHLKKAGTPTMGGIIFLVGIIVSALVSAEQPTSLEMVTLVGITLGFGLIGFIDDFIKVVMHRSLGLRAYQKLIGQFGLAFILMWVSVKWLGRGTDVAIPFTSVHLELNWFYYVLISLLIVLMTNAVNLTDGLDGLAAGSTMFAGAAYVVIALLAAIHGVAVLAHETDMAVFAAALVGGTLGFLRFNTYPARIFMGDTGSLALGGALASLAVLTKSELVLIVIGGLFAVEALSVILQVASFQTTGKRIFRMSPLHHHFELVGWSEWKVVIVFWSVALICAVLGIIGYMPTLG